MFILSKGEAIYIDESVILTFAAKTYNNVDHEEIYNMPEGKYNIIEPLQYNSVDEDKQWLECIHCIQRCAYKVGESLVTINCDRHRNNPRHMLSCYCYRKCSCNRLSMQQSTHPSENDASTTNEFHFNNVAKHFYGKEVREKNVPCAGKCIYPFL